MSTQNHECTLLYINTWILNKTICRYTRGEREYISGTRTWVQMFGYSFTKLRHIGLLNHHHACLAICST